MKRLYYLVIIFSLFGHLAQLWAYTFNRTASGKEIAWGTLTSNLTFYVNPSNNDGLSDQEVLEIIENSFSQWSNYLPFSINVQTNYSQAQSGQNDIYFSNTKYFGTGVLGITEIKYQADTGKILEADIIFNDRYFFVSDPSSTKNETYSSVFLGDLSTHEGGHALGHAHSAVIGSTMLSVANKGQWSLGEDDKIATLDLYNKDVGGGRLGGYIVGSQEHIPVFGAHVSLISLMENKVLGGVWTDREGEFEFSGVSESDAYFLFVSPLKLSASLPDYYLSSVSDYCVGGDYRSDFFQKCGAKSRGRPALVQLPFEGAELDLENITIHCQLGIHEDYLQGKDSYQNLELFHEQTQSYGLAQTGYFNDFLLGTQSDNYTINLDQFDSSSGNYYLQVGHIAQGLGSELATKMRITTQGVDNFYPTCSQSLPGIDCIDLDDDLNPDLDYVARIPLDINPSLNIFDIELTPFEISVSENPFSANEVIPGSSIFKDEIRFYLLTFFIVQKMMMELLPWFLPQS